MEKSSKTWSPFLQKSNIFSVKSMFLLKKLLCKGLISRTFWALLRFIVLFQTVKIQNQHFSVKSTFLLRKLVKSCFHEPFLAWSHFIVFFHTPRGNTTTWFDGKICKVENYNLICSWFDGKFPEIEIYVQRSHACTAPWLSFDLTEKVKLDSVLQLDLHFNWQKTGGE